MNEGYGDAVKAGYGNEDSKLRAMGEALAAKEDPGRELDRFRGILSNQLEELDRAVQKIIERTAPVAAMDRSVPTDPETSEERMPETEFGSFLMSVAQSIRFARERLTDHCYKLEL